MDSMGLKKYATRRLLFSFVMMVVFIILANSTIYTFNNTYSSSVDRIEINREDIQRKDGNKITVSELEELKRDYSFTYLSKKAGIINSNTYLQNVKAIMTDSNFINFNNITMIKGSFLNEKSCEVGSNVVAISDKLALDLFMSIDVVGSFVTLFDERYRIVGVYSQRKPIYSHLWHDGVEKVFIPFKSIMDSAVLPVDTIILRGDKISLEKFKVEFLRQSLSKNYSINTLNYKINDYYNSMKAVNQFGLALMFIIGILCMLLILIKFSRYCLNVYKAFKSEAIKKYISEMVISQKLQILKLLAYFALSILSIVIIFAMTRFIGHIPADFIPSDNIFDIKFYINKIFGDIYNSNSMTRYEPTQFENDLSNMTKLYTVFIVFLILAFLITISALRLKKLIELSSIMIYKIILISVPISLLMAYIFSALLGLVFHVDFFHIAIYFVFIILHDSENLRRISDSTTLDTNINS